MEAKKPITLKERLAFILNYVKNFIFIIVPLLTFIGYVSVLVIKDTDVYKRVNSVVVWFEENEDSFKKVEEVVNWYEEKSKSFAVGLRVNKVKNDDGKTIYKTVYKATNGETYPAVYSSEFGYWFYMNAEGIRKECH